ncbi:glycine zipper 2TM domain-containing protein [Enterobacter hormaechei]|uniref:glycine zipper 2TM domain-containing protein n=1 Tax=Enterobacter hormaechei TaxID=158836 RepID=UPI002A758201|nr:glycine zipper 2TM domain-containing protein [Enterobacter hormaechei]MDY3572301.1 glycine zipper 2TM domain-containing protein [Enterobacter hormaechei]
MRFIRICFISVISMVTLTACAPNTSQYAANSYNTQQLNSRQETKTVEIIAISDAKVIVDNTAQKQRAQLGGALLGGVAGGVIGHNTGKGSDTNTALAAAGGAAGGALLGSAVKDQVEAEGVSLTYKDDGKVYTSTQIGKHCEFAIGIAVLMSTDGKETRIQPNAKCPVEPKA